MTDFITRGMGFGMVVKCEETSFALNSHIDIENKDTVLVLQKGKLAGGLWGGHPSAKGKKFNKKTFERLKKKLFAKAVECDIYYVDTGKVEFKCNDNFSLSNGCQLSLKMAICVSPFGIANQDWVDYHINSDKAMYYSMASTKGVISGIVKKAILDVAPKFFKGSSAKANVCATDEITTDSKLPETERQFFKELGKKIDAYLKNEYYSCHTYLSKY